MQSVTLRTTPVNWWKAIGSMLVAALISLLVSFVVQLRSFGLGPDRLAGIEFKYYELFFADVALQGIQTAIVAAVVLSILRPRLPRDVVFVTLPVVLLRWLFIGLGTTYLVPVQGFAEIVIRSSKYIGVLAGAVTVALVYWQVRLRLTKRSTGHNGDLPSR